MESIDVAIKTRSAVPEMLTALAQETVTRSEFAASEARLSALEEVKGQAQIIDPRIAELEAKVDALLAAMNNTGTVLPDAPDPKPAKPGKAGK